MTYLLSMMIFAWVGAVTPGPVNVVATSAGVSFGFWRALPHVLGASLGYAVVVAICGVGLSKLLLQIPILQSIVQLAGGLFLLYVAYKIATTHSINWQDNQLEKPPSALSGAMLQWLNPKAWLVASSGITLFVTHHQSPYIALLIFCSVSLVICMIGVGTWAVLGFGLRQILKNATYLRWINGVMALLLVMLVFKLTIPEIVTLYVSVANH